MNTRYMLIMMVLLSLLLAACGGDDEDEDSNSNNNSSNATTAPASNATEAAAPVGDDNAAGGSVSAEDAEAAIVAFVSGKYADAAGFFCDDVKSQVESYPAPTTPAMDGVTISATCTDDGGNVTCDVKSTTSGVDVPLGKYSMAVTNGQLCGLPNPVQ